MFVTRLLRKIKKLLKIALLVVSRRMNSIHFLLFKSKKISDASLEANLLVVKKEIYADIAKICIESFLFYHPNSSVRVHVDSTTEFKVHRKLARTIKRGQVKIEVIQDQNKTWQDSKLDLVLSLSDTKQFFMDADLKWNGIMPKIDEITLFVDEFKFTDNVFYTPLFEKDWFSDYLNSTMKNTSFFYWCGYSPTQNDIEEINLIMRKVSEVSSDPRNDAVFNQSTLRIGEQIALSLVVEKTGRPIKFLKESDGFKDGSFVESSYFGATGTSF